MTNREFYLSCHICPICIKEELYENEKICPRCREMNLELQARYYRENRDSLIAKMRTRGKNRYAQRVADGICTRCGKFKAESGKRKCKACQIKENEYAMSRRKSTA